jgi:hypothetical protein
MGLSDAGRDTKYDGCITGIGSAPITPAKNEPMPQTIEYYIKRGAMDLELIMEMKEEISRLKQNNEKLRVKLNCFKSGKWPEQ